MQYGESSGPAAPTSASISKTRASVAGFTISRGDPVATISPSTSATMKCGVAGGLVNVVEDHHDCAKMFAMEAGQHFKHF